MRRARRSRKRKAGKHLSLSATDADWEIVRGNSERRGLSIARYLVELVERDAAEEDAGLRHEGLRHEGPTVALAREEQRELLEAVREVRALMVEGEDAVPLVAANLCAGVCSRRWQRLRALPRPAPASSIAPKRCFGTAARCSDSPAVTRCQSVALLSRP